MLIEHYACPDTHKKLADAKMKKAFCFKSG